MERRFPSFVVFFVLADSNEDTLQKMDKGLTRQSGDNGSF
jgi:hypothetical protein